MPHDNHAHREDHLREFSSRSVNVLACNQGIGDAYVSIHIDYGFTEEELDSIVNHDIKYRMGRGR